MSSQRFLRYKICLKTKENIWENKTRYDQLSRLKFRLQNEICQKTKRQSKRIVERGFKRKKFQKILFLKLLFKGTLKNFSKLEDKQKKNFFLPQILELKNFRLFKTLFQVSSKIRLRKQIFSHFKLLINSNVLPIKSFMKNIRKEKINPNYRQKLIKYNLDSYYARRQKSFASKLLEKQKLKAYYGQIPEKQLIHCFKNMPFENQIQSNGFIGFLEQRLDVIVFRMNFSKSIFEAAQLIQHGHILVNKEKVTSPSFQVKPRSLIEVVSNSYPFIIKNFQWIEKAKLHSKYKKYLKYRRALQLDLVLRQKINFFYFKKKFIFSIYPKEKNLKRNYIKSPFYIEVNYKILSGIFLYKPCFREIPLKTSFNVSRIIEYYRTRS